MRIITLCSFFSCAELREYDVEYSVYRLPISGLKELNFLGVGKTSNMGRGPLERLAVSLQKCGQYQRISRIDRNFSMNQIDQDLLQKKLKSEIASTQDARYVHGILVIDQLEDESTHEEGEIKLVTVTDGLEHQWMSSFGYSGRPISQTFNYVEIAPRTKANSQEVRQKIFERTLSWRFTLYNKTKDIIVFDRKVKMRVRLKNYSVKPRITDKIVDQALVKEMVEHISGFVCPKIADVERQLLARREDSKSDELVNEGVDLASDDNWEAAANHWKKAVLIDRKSATAYHNLGVYYEKLGLIPEAMEEFLKAKNAGQQSYHSPLYDVALSLYTPRMFIPTSDVRIFAVGGSHWVLLSGGEFMNYRIGSEYPIYRLQRVTKRSDFVFDGIEFIEVGKLKLIRKDGKFLQGRISQFVEAFGILGGDVMVTNVE